MRWHTGLGPTESSHGWQSPRFPPPPHLTQPQWTLSSAPIVKHHVFIKCSTSLFHLKALKRKKSYNFFFSIFPSLFFCKGRDYGLRHVTSRTGQIKLPNQSKKQHSSAKSSQQIFFFSKSLMKTGVQLPFSLGGMGTARWERS